MIEEADAVPENYDTVSKQTARTSRDRKGTIESEEEMKPMTRIG